MDQKLDTMNYKINSFGVGIKLGKEFRKPITDFLEFRFGADFSFSYQQEKQEYIAKTTNNNIYSKDYTSFMPVANLVFGLNYVCKNNFIIGPEILPYFHYTLGTSNVKNTYINNVKEEKQDVSGFSYGLSNTSALLSVVYRF